METLLFPWLLAEASTAPGSQGEVSGLQLDCGRVGSLGYSGPCTRKNPNSPTSEMVGLLKNNYKSLIPSQENKI